MFVISIKECNLFTTQLLSSNYHKFDSNFLKKPLIRSLYAILFKVHS